MRRGLVVVAVVAVLRLGLAAPSGAATIVQTVGMHFAEHGTQFDDYLPFDPSLGPLDQVVIAIAGTARSNKFDFTNTSNSPVTFTGTVGLQFTAADQPVNFTATFMETLPPGSTDFHAGVEGGFSVTSYYYPPLTNFMGSLPLGPDVQFPFFWVDHASASDPSIAVSAGSLRVKSLDAVETVTYVYGVGATLLPEPASAAMLGLGLAGIGGLSWWRRRVAR